MSINKNPYGEIFVRQCTFGSVLVSTVPKPGCWKWHGFLYPTEEFYTQLAELNGLEIERLFVYAKRLRS